MAVGYFIIQLFFLFKITLKRKKPLYLKQEGKTVWKIIKITNLIAGKENQRKK